MVINIEKVREKFKHYRVYSRGYMGLFMYTVFLVSYFACLRTQQHEPAIGQANTALLYSIEKTKADLVVSDSATMWKFMTGKLMALYFGPAWASETVDGQQLSGEFSEEFFSLIGGLSITAIKSHKRACFRGQDCYSDRLKSDPFVDIYLPDSNASFRVPYNTRLGGYTVGIPSTISGTARSQLISAYSGLFGPDTREIIFEGIFFNPSGDPEQTLTDVIFKGSISPNDLVSFSTTLMTIPYHLYPRRFWKRLVYACLHMAIPLLFFWFFTRSLFFAKHRASYFHRKVGLNEVVAAARNREARGETGLQRIQQFVRQKVMPAIHKRKEKEKEQEEVAIERLRVLQRLDVLPVNRLGEVYMALPIVLHTVLYMTAVLWLVVVLYHWRIKGLNDNSENGLFVNPLHDYDSASLLVKVNLAQDFLNHEILPLMFKVIDACRFFSFYFSAQIVVVSLLMLRFFQYLSFQRRLSVVTDTFTGIVDELFHMSIVFGVVCLTIGLQCSIAYGALDMNFQSLWAAFYETVEACFGMFKPAATTPYTPPLFKYVPHISISDASLGWESSILTLVWKVLVMLLLFKLLIGVIMEGYKKHCHPKSYPHTVREELSEIRRIVWYYFWNHRIQGDPWVPFEHVIMALCLIHDAFANDKHNPWRKHFVGLIAGEIDIVDALNAVVDPSVDGRIPVHAEKIGVLRGISRHHRFKKCGQREVEYVLLAFGRSRESCVAELRKKVMQEEKDKKKKEIEKKLMQEKPKRHETIEQHSEEHVHGVLHELDALLAERGNIRLHAKAPSEENVHKVFQAFDFYMTGYIDIRFLAEILGPHPGLEFDLTSGTIRKIIEMYDKDEDQLLTWPEFRKLTQDPAILRRFNENRMSSKGTCARSDEDTLDFKSKAKNRSSVTGALLKSKSGVHFGSASKSLNEPLLKGEKVYSNLD